MFCAEKFSPLFVVKVKRDEAFRVCQREKMHCELHPIGEGFFQHKMCSNYLNNCASMRMPCMNNSKRIAIIIH